MSYKSPIEIIYGEMTNKLENEVFTAVQNIGINIDKDELIKALQYDRNQYEIGYADAMLNAVPVVRCKDCKYMEHAINGKGEHGFCCTNKYSPVDENYWLDGDWFCADGEGW